MFDVCSKNGEILPMTDATVPVSNIEYAYGFGVYEAIRIVHGTPVFLGQHLERLFMSARTIGLEHLLTHQKLQEWISALLEAINVDTCNLKILLIGGTSAELTTLWILPLAPLFPEKKIYRDGVPVLTATYERFLPHAKTLNMLPSYLLYSKARKAGCYDALLLDHEGNITEGTRTNVLAIRGRTIISPPVEKILEGVMRANVLEVAGKNNFEYREEKISLAAIDDYDGFFLTSTSSKILPISRIDDSVISMPETLQELMGAFKAFLMSIRTEPISLL